MNAKASAFRKKVDNLSAETRKLLAMGAEYWSNHGPGDVGPELGALMRFAPGEDPGRDFTRIAASLNSNEPVTMLDLTRALFVTEIGWSSNVVGPGDWENLYGHDQDAATLVALRAVQEELDEHRVPASGTDPFGHYPLPG